MNRDNRQQRNTLKEYFKKGKTPTEEQFAALIDSVPNIKEDGQVADIGNGWAFYPGQGDKLAINLYTEEPVSDTESPVWSFSVTPEKHLLIKNEKGQTVLEVAQDKSFVLHGNLTVENTVTASVFQTTGGGGITPGYLTIPADKQWHDLPMDGSTEGFGHRVYYLHASLGGLNMDVCKLTRITAIWLDNMEQRIESPQKHWWGWSGGICFRWQKRYGKPYLQMRSKQLLPSGEIHYRIVEMYKG